MNTSNLILLDPPHRKSFYPLSWSRPVATFRLGILTIAEKWALRFHAEVSHAVSGHLAHRFQPTLQEANHWVLGNVLPSPELCQIITQLSIGEVLTNQGNWIAGHFNRSQMQQYLDTGTLDGVKLQAAESYQIRSLQKLWELFQWNEFDLKEDFALITNGRSSAPIPAHVQCLGNELFIEAGAVLHPCTLNATTGPIYIGKHAEIMEGSLVRGGLALCEGAQLKMGSKIYGATTIGPQCRVGGEVNNSIFQGYSNKAHDGFLGNSIIGEWVNIGADTNASNLKNNYENVKQWDYSTNRFEKTGGLFCGLVMGDHSKCGINTMFNTGTVVGFGANVFGSGFPRQFIPDFAWGGASGFQTFGLSQFFTTAERVMERRGLNLSEQEKQLIAEIFQQSKEYRSWETE